MKTKICKNCKHFKQTLEAVGLCGGNTKQWAVNQNHPACEHFAPYSPDEWRAKRDWPMYESLYIVESDVQNAILRLKEGDKGAAARCLVKASQRLPHALWLLAEAEGKESNNAEA